MIFDEYFEKVKDILKEIIEKEREKMKMLGERIYENIRNKGIVYAFGTGHSHMLVEELFYRAGGLVPIYPVFVSSLMLHEGAYRSSKLERLEGFGKIIAETTPITDKDVVLVFSNSGVNSVPVEFAYFSKQKGAYIGVITSFDHTAKVKTKNSLNKKLYEIADVAIDNHVPYGDTIFEMKGFKFTPISSIAGIFILNSIVSHVVELFMKDGIEPELFMSANTENGDSHNEEKLKEYIGRIPF